MAKAKGKSVSIETNVFPSTFEVSDYDRTRGVCKVGLCINKKTVAHRDLSGRTYLYESLTPYTSPVFNKVREIQSNDKVTVTYQCPVCGGKKVVSEGVYLCVGGTLNGQRMPTSLIPDDYIQYNAPQNSHYAILRRKPGTWRKNTLSVCKAVYIHMSMLESNNEA